MLKNREGIAKAKKVWDERKAGRPKQVPQFENGKFVGWVHAPQATNPS